MTILNLGIWNQNICNRIGPYSALPSPGFCCAAGRRGRIHLLSDPDPLPWCGNVSPWCGNVSIVAGNGRMSILEVLVLGRLAKKQAVLGLDCLNFHVAMLQAQQTSGHQSLRTTCSTRRACCARRPLPNSP